MFTMSYGGFSSEFQPDDSMRISAVTHAATGQQILHCAEASRHLRIPSRQVGGVERTYHRRQSLEMAVSVLPWHAIASSSRHPSRRQEDLVQHHANGESNDVEVARIASL